MFKSFHPRRIGHKPCPQDQHAGRVDHGVKRLSRSKASLSNKRTVKCFCNIFDGHLVDQRLIVQVSTLQSRESRAGLTTVPRIDRDPNNREQAQSEVS